MITILVLLILVDVFSLFVLVVIDTFFFVRVVLLKTTHVIFSRLPLFAEAILSLPHGVVATEHGILIVSIIIEYLLFLGSLLLVLELVDDFLLLVSSLLVFQVILIKLVFEVIDVSEFFNIDLIVLFKLLLKSLVLFLVLRLDVLNTLEPLLGSLKLLLLSGELVDELALIQLKLLDRFLHLLHLGSLRADDVLNALLDIDLLRVGIEVPRD